MSVTSDKIRIEWKKNDAVRDAGLTTPDDVQRFDNISYGPVKKWNELDVYRPKAVAGKLPVIINVHGGGWVYGDKELYQYYAMNLAQRGFAVVNFSYRLAPESKFPAPLEDTNMVVEWMFANQKKYDFDMQHVFMVGDSAGAHLAALYAAICTNQKYASAFDFKVPNNFVPTALCLNCGVYVPVNIPIKWDSDQDKALMEDFLPDKGTLEEAHMVNVPEQITENFPPSFIMSCLGDFCLPHVPKLVNAMAAHKVPFTCKVYGTKENPLYHVFHVTIQEEEGQKCNQEECEFFTRFLLNPKVS